MKTAVPGMRAHFHRLTSIAVSAFLLLSPIAARGQEPAKQAATQADDWFTINKDYTGQRYVNQDQITPRTVGRLKEVCEIDLNEPSWFSSGILKIGSTLYFTTRRVTYAIDGTTCKLLWREVIDDENPEPASPNNRGLAYLDGKLFRGTSTAHLIALDAATGKVLWDVPNRDPDALKESMIAAPIAWDGKVFIGIATADFAVRGRVMGFDANTGAELWRFYTVPVNSDHPPNFAGGAFWSTFSLDAATGELFAPSSNPAPDYTGDERPGANLHTNSLLVLDAATGKLNWEYQSTPHDIHDWDLGNPASLYRTADGKDIASVAAKDGHIYGIDRASHVPVFDAVGTTLANGALPFPSNLHFPPAAAVRVCPGTVGGAQFTGTAYDPQRGALYVGMTDWCWFYFSAPDGSGQMLGDTQPDFSLGTPPRGWITAIDGATGKLLWQYHAAAQVTTGLVPTKGGILFGGDTLGNLVALDATSGAVLKTIDVKGALNSGLISYAIAGAQYVATEVGGLSFGLPGITRPLRVGGPLRVKIFGLSGSDKPKVVTLSRVPTLPGKPPEQKGKRLYAALCQICHGPSGEGGLFPTLAPQYHALTDPQRLKAFFANVPPPMATLYPGLLHDDDIQSLVSYFKTLNFPPQPGYTQPTSAGDAGWPAIYAVLTYPRCINCHTAADYPRQTDVRHPHYYGVTRGEVTGTDAGTGSAIAHCSSCHGTQNNAFTSVPGAGSSTDPWRLAPLGMAWEASPNFAMSGNELCTVLKNPAMNGGRDLDMLLTHVATEPLVLWAWNPGRQLDGVKRTTPSIGHAEFVAKFKTWVAAGGPCPPP